MKKLLFSLALTVGLFSMEMVHGQTAKILASQTEICEGGFVVFADSSYGANFSGWTWGFPGGTPLGSTQQNPDTVYYHVSGTYKVTMQVNYSKGFSAGWRNDTVVVTVHPKISPDTAISNSPICAGESLRLTTLDSNMTYNYTWNKLDSSFIAYSRDTIRYPSDTSMAGSYIVTFTDTNGCTAQDTVTVVVHSLPQIGNITGTLQNNDSYDFSASGISNANNYFWDFDDGDTSANAAPNHKYAQTGNYQVKLVVSNDHCSDSASTTINYIATGIAHNKLDKRQVHLYPNPARNVITVKAKNNNTMKSFSVYNILGEEIFNNKTNNATSYQLDVRNYSAGLYYIKITMEDDTVQQSKFEVAK